MRPGHYTELFFLDEATALAAGHRPCMECQRDRATEFKRIWNEVNKPIKSLVEMDDVLQNERTINRPITEISALPNGAMVSISDEPFLVQNGRLVSWTFAGYRDSNASGQLLLLTPPSTVRVLSAGFGLDVNEPRSNS
jgi:hypothetical protein